MMEDLDAYFVAVFDFRLGFGDHNVVHGKKRLKSCDTSQIFLVSQPSVHVAVDTYVVDFLFPFLQVCLLLFFYEHG